MKKLFIAFTLAAVVAISFVSCRKTTNDSETHTQEFTFGTTSFDINNAITIENIQYNNQTYNAIVMSQNEMAGFYGGNGKGVFLIFKGNFESGTYNLLFNPQNPLGHFPMYLVAEYGIDDLVNISLDTLLSKADVYAADNGSFTLTMDKSLFTITTTDVEIKNVKDPTQATTSSVDFKDKMMRFVVAPMNDDSNYSIFKFTLKDIAGSLAINASDFKISDSTGNVIVSFATSPAADEFYVVMPILAAGTYWVNATVEGKPYISKLTFDSATIAGQYDTKQVNMATLGDLMGADGNFYDGAASVASAGTTAIGVISHLGMDEFSENGTEVNGKPFVGHGLVLCLVNAAMYKRWSNVPDLLEFPNLRVHCDDELLRTTGVGGYTSTRLLAEKPDNMGYYPAAKIAMGFTGLEAPAGTTGWFIPSAPQWVSMLSDLGGLDVRAIAEDGLFVRWIDNELIGVNRWENALRKAGEGNYHGILPYRGYWSCSEYDMESAVSLQINGERTGDTSGFLFGIEDKGLDCCHIRTALAF